MTDAREAAARALAGLEPGEEWPTNAALGGGLTGTRDDEYHQAMLEQAEAVIDVVGPLIRADERRKLVTITSGADNGRWPIDTSPAAPGPLTRREPEPLPIHRTEANPGSRRCSTCDGAGCLDCTDPA